MKIKNDNATPSLGLGLIGTQLSSRGHMVDIHDYHREIIGISTAAANASDFDYVGVNCVTSTLKATSEFANALLAERTDTKLVLGGQGASFLARSIQSNNIYFDAVVIGDGVGSMSSIVERWPDVDDSNIFLRSEPLPAPKGFVNLRENSARRLSDSWEGLPWIDRKLFKNKDGKQYEPSPTKNSNHREAHFVSSTGCNWGCSFCTEAKLNGRIGEIRRNADDLVLEVDHSIFDFDADRIQFIDDNVFPTGNFIGPQRRAANVNWVEKFLSGLSRVKHRNSDFGWRGLLRLEDLLVYENEIPDFWDLMKASGCFFLATGIEHGNEGMRASAKGRAKGAENLSNREIEDAVSRISEAGIFTKGYFIIGGPNETSTTIFETIDFAKRAGFSVAYFAIYKNFRRIAATSSESDIPRFDTMLFSDLDLEDVSGLPKKLFANHPGRHTESDLQQIENAMRGLRERGFSFEKIFKYNDYHDDDWSRTYDEVGGTNLYLEQVRNAYVEFYCRESWLNTYDRLLAAGY